MKKLFTGRSRTTRVEDVIVVGPDDEFNRSLSEALNARLIPLRRRVFPDGEVCPRVMLESQDELRGESVVLSMRERAGECAPNRYLAELLLTISNLKRDLGVSEVHLVMPYFPYARQDTIFLSLIHI